ncbi:hypothetical protein PIB30_086606 [Stylosanthes scabra]|uniref:DUF7745 domain-containing protein n=1 Tax=Stylosanthes scabra TaxID=79078 RepID=A0ABU6XTS7_9FABA|nr:hypothetical protein [Stylosanthes scabra]
MTWEAQSAFRRAYGQILDLLLISMETPVLSALSQFWNSSIRAFELPELDIVPTIEEYSVMIRELYGFCSESIKRFPSHTSAAPRDYGMERRDREHRTKQIFMGMSMISWRKLHCKLWRNPECAVDGS